MSSRNDVLTITKIEFDEAACEEAAATASRAAMQAGAEVVLNEAQENVPYDTGELSSTAQIAVSDDGFEAAVAYGTEYAHILRAHPEWEYQGGRSGRWLDEAVESSSSAVGAAMADAASSAWPSG